VTPSVLLTAATESQVLELAAGDAARDHRGREPESLEVITSSVVGVVCRRASCDGAKRGSPRVARS